MCAQSVCAKCVRLVCAPSVCAKCVRNVCAQRVCAKCVRKVHAQSVCAKCVRKLRVNREESSGKIPEKNSLNARGKFAKTVFRQCGNSGLGYHVKFRDQV